MNRQNLWLSALVLCLGIGGQFTTAANTGECSDICSTSYCNDSCYIGFFSTECGYYGACIDMGHVCGDYQCNAEEGESCSTCERDCYTEC